jgi:predicted dehydrogenase
LFLARFKGGAVGSFEATRFATGYQNKNGVEIHGEKGAISIDFEDLSWLRFYDRTEDRKVQGWHRINVSHAPDHPYAAAWWPDAHPIGYEHTFINQAADMLNELGGKAAVTPLPDFADAYKTQEVLEAASLSAAEHRPVKISEFK